MKILYADWMQELDSRTINGIGVPSIVLMENASQGAARFFARCFPLPQYRHVIIFAGKGNNGGDGLAAGRILAQYGYKVRFFLLASPAKLNPDPLINFNIVKKLNFSYTVIENTGQLEQVKTVLQSHHPGETFLIDALFGTGLNKPVRPGLFADVIHMMNDSPFPAAAIDIPSGLSDAFLPEEGPHVEAAVTATFHALKTAHLHPDGNKYCGTIEIIDIGIPPHLETEEQSGGESGETSNEKYYVDMIEPGDFKEMFTPRPVDAHKGTYGHCLTVCGSNDKPGAGILSSFAVLKSGAGLCTAAVCPGNRTLPVTVHPELMTHVYREPAGLLERLDEFNSVLTGPGLGNTKETAETVELLIAKSNAPLVLDADALNVLHDRKDILKKSTRPIAITPHPGEFSRLTGRTVTEIKKNRIGLSRDFAQEYRAHVILKGHHTLIAAPDGRVFVNPTGNAGMATAGSGDVLSGMIAGMVSQFTPGFPFEKILQAAVFIHGYAGDLAAKETGEISLTATDIMRFIPAALEGLNDYRTPFQLSR